MHWEPWSVVKWTILLLDFKTTRALWVLVLLKDGPMNQPDHHNRTPSTGLTQMWDPFQRLHQSDFYQDGPLGALQIVSCLPLPLWGSLTLKSTNKIVVYWGVSLLCKYVSVGCSGQCLATCYTFIIWKQFWTWELYWSGAAVKHYPLSIFIIQYNVKCKCSCFHISEWPLGS